MSCREKYTGIFVFFLILSTGVFAISYARSAESYYDRGNQSYNNEEYDQAIENYERALSQDIKLIGVFNNLVNIYIYQKKNYVKAEQVCLDGLAYYPFDESLILLMMYIDLNVGRIDKAIAKYKALSQQELSYSLVFPTEEFEKIMKEKEASEEDVIQTYNNLLSFNPKDFNLFYKIAEYYKNNRKYQEALDIYKKVLELNSRMEIVYTGIATCYYNLGEFDIALEYFKKARKAGYYVPDIFFKKLEEERVKPSGVVK